MLLDILEIFTPIIKLFEAEHLLPFEVQSVSVTITNIDDYINTSINDVMLLSHLESFCVIDRELNLSFIKANSDCKHVNKDSIQKYY